MEVSRGHSPLIITWEKLKTLDTNTVSVLPHVCLPVDMALCVNVAAVRYGGHVLLSSWLKFLNLFKSSLSRFHQNFAGSSLFNKSLLFLLLPIAVNEESERFE